MGRPESFDVCDNLAPHVPLFMGIGGFILGQPTSRTVASRHFGEMDGVSQESIVQQPTGCGVNDPGLAASG